MELGLGHMVPVMARTMARMELELGRMAPAMARMMARMELGWDVWCGRWHV